MKRIIFVFIMMIVSIALTVTVVYAILIYRDNYYIGDMHRIPQHEPGFTTATHAAESSIKIPLKILLGSFQMEAGVRADQTFLIDQSLHLTSLFPFVMEFAATASSLNPSNSRIMIGVIGKNVKY